MSIPLPETGHEPVLLDACLDWLRPASGGIYVDCTVGRGGHSLAIADRAGLGSTLIGLDYDAKNLEYAATRLAGHATRLFHANFGRLADVLAEAGVPLVDGILADLGISTNQLFDESYGLSFDRDAPLDMRLDTRQRLTARQIINAWPENEIADTLYDLSDERFSRRIARKVVETRRLSPINTTGQLADLVRSAVPKSPPWKKHEIDPATRTFMALRMAVNDEFGNLERLLKQAPLLLKPGGRLAIISFHSIEDRLVKQAFRAQASAGAIGVLTNRPQGPDEAEVARNPRARSAKLRVIERLRP